MTEIIMPNITDIILNNKLESEYNVINELEDTIIDLYDKKSDSAIFENDLLLLTEINCDNTVNINFYSDFDIEKLNLNEKILNNFDKIVITGSLLRSILIDTKSIGTEIRKEIYISCIKNLNPIDIITPEYKETDVMYYTLHNDIYIYIYKTTYRNPSQVILQNCNLKRIGCYLNKIYCSPMFIADYNKYLDTINSNLIEPVFKTKLDVFDVHVNYKRDITIFDVINKKNYDYYKKQIVTNQFKFDQIKNGETVIEYTLHLFSKEENDIIRGQIKLIIMDLNEKNYIRPAAFYAEILKINILDEDLFNRLGLNNLYKSMPKLNFEQIKNISDINNEILKYYISNDLSNEFYSFLKNKDDKFLKIDINIFNYLIEKNPKNIIINGIKSNYFSDRSKYKLILWTQNLDYFNIIGDEFNIDLATNFIEEIIENCLIKSFYFLYKIDDTIINTYDSDGNTFLHNITQKNKYQDMIKILLKLDDGIIYKKNKLNQTALLKHIENKNFDIVSILIDFILETKNEHSFKVIDLKGENILHYLCKTDRIDLIKKIIPFVDDIINIKNNDLLTPIMIAAQNSQEDIIYLLKSINADLLQSDKYGNTVYHYICLNELCVGIPIQNRENIFGYKPSDYCKIALNYYYFI
jgi:hypothetical protein